MRLTTFVAACLACLTFSAPTTSAGDLAPPYLQSDDPTAAAFILASAETVVTLVRSERKITLDGVERDSDLRVSLVAINTGTGTDVSPITNIYLVMFNDVKEHGIAWAMEPVTSGYGLEDFERTEAGKYDVFLRTINLSGAFGGCPFTLSKISIDARQLSVAVRQAKGLPEFGTKRYNVPLGLTSQQLGCS